MSLMPEALIAYNTNLIQYRYSVDYYYSIDSFFFYVTTSPSRRMPAGKRALIETGQHGPRLPPSHLDFGHHAHAPVGITCRPEVKTFIEVIKGKPPPPRLLPVIGPRHQRLQAAVSVEQRPPMGVLSAEDRLFLHTQTVDTRTAFQRAGLPVERESYLHIPKARLELVVRPGFRERVQQRLTEARQYARLQETAFAAARQAQVERIRAETSSRAKAGRQVCVEQPVMRARERAQMRGRQARERAVRCAATRVAADDVATQLPLFEECHNVALPLARASGPWDANRGHRARSEPLDLTSDKLFPAAWQHKSSRQLYDRSLDETPLVRVGHPAEVALAPVRGSNDQPGREESPRPDNGSTTAHVADEQACDGQTRHPSHAAPSFIIDVSPAIGSTMDVFEICVNPI